jgi:hypothetical protein
MLHRKTVLILVMAVLVLSAGMVLGWVWTPLQKVDANTAVPGGGPRPWFDQLGLSPDQKKEMDQIWSDVRSQRQKLFETRREMDHDRDAQIMALLDDSQQAAYKKINDDFRAKREDLEKQQDALITDASQRSRALLDDSQKKRWDILSADMHRRHGPMGLSTQRSTTMPSHGAGGYYN